MAWWDFTSNHSVSNVVSSGQGVWWSSAQSLGNQHKSRSGVTVNHQSAMAVATANACTRAISQTLASLPVQLYEAIGDRARQKLNDNPLYELLHTTPNPEMDSMTFFEMQTERLVNRGNAFAEIEFDIMGKPIALWPLHNSRVRVWRTPQIKTQDGKYVGGEVEYHVCVGDIVEGFPSRKPKDEEKYYTIPADRMLNVVGHGSQNGITAPGVLYRAAETLGNAIAAQEFAGAYFGNGARPGGVIEHPKLMPDESLRRQFREDINRIHQGRENWNNIGILWDGAKWNELSHDPEKAQMVQSRQFEDKQICKFYDVPPAIVQIYEDFKFNSVESMIKLFIMLTIRPYAERWERAIGRQILSFTDIDMLVEFTMNALLRGNPKEQAETNEIKRRNGIINGNEWRAEENANPIDGPVGEAYLAPLNFGTMDQIVGRSVDEVDITTGDSPKKPKSTSGKAESHYVENIFENVFSRMRSIERKAVLRAADSENFLSSVDSFYESFVEKLFTSLSDCADALLRLGGYPDRFSTEPLIRDACKKWCDQNQSQFVEASNVQAEELVERITAELNDIESKQFPLEFNNAA